MPPSANGRGDAGGDLPDIPGYTLRKRLGRGGMASVYLATQQSLDRPVAIKVMDAGALDDEIARQRFENEARTIAKLTHPHIVAIHEVGRAGDGRPFYVMPYLGSGDLSQRDFTGDEGRVAQVLQALLSALGYAHARGIVHRDVKRENVLFDADDRPQLTDFGIALSRGGDVRLTTAGLALGSSTYMAPEQARGEVVDGRADLYSVGVLAFELLSGHLPYQSSDALALALMHAQDPIPKLPADKRRWQDFVERAMAKSRDARFANAQDMAQALERIGQRQGILSGPVLATTGAHAGARWKQVLMLLAGAVAIVAATLFVHSHWFGHAASTTAASTAVDAASGTLPVPADAQSNPSLASSPVATPTSTSTALDGSQSSAVAASDTTNADASTANASSASSASAEQADSTAASSPASSASKAKAKRRAKPRRREPKRNFIQRWWHRI
ncbi:MAG: serine/threonine protein kinase [Proteobacteria bacterium]|nr:serine/threonine protein kinase [Pseudomonadota bacterium]